VPSALVINPNRLKVDDLAQFIAAAKDKPGTIELASSGVGTVSHLAIGLLEARADIKLRHFPYRGFADALQALTAGEVGATLAPVSGVLDAVKAGKLKVLAIANQRREPLLPDVPTFAEAGLADFRVGTWYGLFAPKDTPTAILDRMHAAVQVALDNAEVKRVWQQAGAKVELESRLHAIRRAGNRHLATHRQRREHSRAVTVGNVSNYCLLGIRPGTTRTLRGLAIQIAIAETTQQTIATMKAQR
jgi:tripartite-type tricarboxylate transporter receptor subunit TctC